MLKKNPLTLCVEGNRYTKQVPDTLDLAERMGLALNALTNVWMPEQRWALPFIVDFSRRPPVLFVNHLTDAYLNIPPKFLEALLLCRLASGNGTNLNVDEGVIGAQLDLIAEDGLTYCPTDTLADVPGERPFAEVWGEGRSLIALSLLAQVDDDPLWVQVGKRKVDRLLALTSEKDDFRFLGKGRFRPGELPSPEADEPIGSVENGSLVGQSEYAMRVVYSVGALGHGAGLFYRVSDYEPALKLSEGLARWALARVFKHEDGRWNLHHFHHSLYALMAVCEYGWAVNSHEVLERVDACYRWAREMGDPLIGFYPEAMPGSSWYLGREGNTVEICEVADMVFLALYLTRAGMGDYWDDIDRWVRNIYAEGQFRNMDLIEQIPASYLQNTRPVQGRPRYYVDTDDIGQRSLGSFFGWMRANDGLNVVQTEDGPRLSDHSIMHCCTANGARTLYFVWDSMVTKTPEEVRVNLLLNRVSPWLDVDSYLPAAGKVVLHIKEAPRVAVRMPEWCDPAQVRATINDQDRRTLVNGPIVRLGWLQPGDEVVLRFPLPEQVIHRVLGEIPYKLTLRGSNITSIDPKGSAYPLFEDQPTGSLVERTCFIPKIQDIIW